MAYSGQEGTVFEPLDLSDARQGDAPAAAGSDFQERAADGRSSREPAGHSRQRRTDPPVVINLITNASEALGNGKESSRSRCTTSAPHWPLNDRRRTHRWTTSAYGQRYRQRHDRRDPRQDLRSLLHHQIHRPRHWVSRPCRASSATTTAPSTSSAGPARAPALKSFFRVRISRRRRPPAPSSARRPCRQHVGPPCWWSKTRMSSASQCRRCFAKWDSAWSRRATGVPGWISSAPIAGDRRGAAGSHPPGEDRPRGVRGVAADAAGR